MDPYDLDPLPRLAGEVETLTSMGHVQNYHHYISAQMGVGLISSN